MTKPRHPDTAPTGASLARRIVALESSPAYSARGLGALAIDLGVSTATLYRWKAGETRRIGRAVARALLAIETEAKTSDAK